MKHLLRLLFPLAVLAAQPFLRAQVPNWPKTTPPEIVSAGTDVQLTGADYGGGVFVLATYFGGGPNNPTITPAVFTSADGTAWTRRSLPASGRTGSPRYLNGKFLLGVTPNGTNGTGGNGVILSSADGAAWTASASLGATINAPGEFAFGNGIYAAPLASTSAQVSTSTDGVNWTNRVIVAGGSSSHITFFGGKFYANCYGSATVAGLYTSADAIIWSKVAGAPANPGILAATNSTLLVTFFSGSSSGQAISSDGVTFVTASPGINLQTETIKVLNGAFVTTASPSPTSFDLTLARASLDGRTWATIGSTANQFYASEVAFGNGHYVFVGEFNVYSGTTNITAGGTGGGSTGGNTGGGTPLTTGYLSNLSIRARAGSNSETLIVGVTVGGTGTSGTKDVLIRGIGPALGAFGVTGALADPVLTVFRGSTQIDSNDDWGTGTNIAATSVSVGAFALPAGSKDAAINATGVGSGSYSIQLTGKGGGTGAGLIELYETASSLTATTPRLTNVSARTFGGTGAETLILGFNVTGSSTRKVLIRAVGPGLAQFGVTGLMADPKLELFNGGSKVGENDTWDSAATLAAQQSVGAFALAAGSKDAVLVATLAPGAYTAQVTAVGGATGVALVEVYEAP